MCRFKALLLQSVGYCIASVQSASLVDSFYLFSSDHDGDAITKKIVKLNLCLRITASPLFKFHIRMKKSIHSYRSSFIKLGLCYPKSVNYKKFSKVIKCFL